MATSNLVTYAQAKAHLKLVDDAEQTDVTLKLQQATAQVLDFVGREDNTWTDATDPGTDLEFAVVQAAILVQLGELYRFRGDDADLPPVAASEGAWLSAPVRRLLHPLRRPSLA